MISSLRHPRRRAVSVGPQSMADAYETIELYRRKQKDPAPLANKLTISCSEANTSSKPTVNLFMTNTDVTKIISENHDTEDDGGLSVCLCQDLLTAQNVKTVGLETNSETIIIDRKYQKVFSQLEKPRIRYDVEVITKIIIYSGMLKYVRWH